MHGDPIQPRLGPCFMHGHRFGPVLDRVSHRGPPSAHPNLAKSRELGGGQGVIRAKKNFLLQNMFLGHLGPFGSVLGQKNFFGPEGSGT